jgi:hypothetical protein
MTNLDNSGWVGSWSPGIGDPTTIGWLTVVLYATAAVVCHRAARRCKDVAQRKSIWLRETALWQLLAVALWFLCINKQLDLQTALTEFGRMLARQQGWYGERRLFQETFIAGLLVLGFFSACMALVVTWRMSRPLKLAMLGFCFIGIFVLIRASSFHRVDVLLKSRLFAVKWNWILEIGGIGVVAVAAVARARPTRKL